MKILATILSLTFLANAAYAAETVSEKASAKTNDVKRAAKSATHRVEEKVCEATDKNCVGTKVENRATETKDYIKDKAKEAGNVIDNGKNH